MRGCPTGTGAPLGRQLAIQTLELLKREALFAVDWLLSDPHTETRTLHRVLIRFAAAD
ncbi:hypothetical protein [Streptomyces angustmyceticus]|uniref:hypothetical protein n=1 Tax=Streptomyces angustmyceticus TaxID=285578 RepID=UPI0021AFB6A3|nr:hypothetical protein [Streptomyces angustmyceticus]